jgi:uncharacterized membrane protein YbhN (UPF0104 family)
MRSILSGAIEALAGASPWLLAAAVGLYGLGVAAAVMRWRTVLGAMGHRVRIVDALLAYLASIFVNNVTPSMRLGGEATRVVAIGIRSRVPAAPATLSIVVDRLFEVPPVAGLVVCAIPALASAGARFDSRARSILIGAIATVGGAVVCWRLIHDASWWKDLRKKIAASPLDWPSLTVVLGCSGTLWALDVWRLLTVAAAFGVTLTVSQGATLAVLGVLGGVVPTVGGLGAIEGGMVAGLMFFGVRADVAAAVTAAERAISYVLATSVGGTAFLVVGGRRLWTAIRSRS